MKLSLFVFILLVPSLVLAGTISLTTSVTTDVLNETKGQIQVRITNLGDEPAYNSQLSLISDYLSSKPVHINKLDVNKPFETNITVEFLNTTIKEGDYPLVLLTEYEDANGYRFSSVSDITLTYKNHYYSQIGKSSIKDLEINGNRGKSLSLKLINRDQNQHNVTLKLFLPKELQTDKTEKTITLKPNEEKDVNFKVSNLPNFGGLPGSSYVVLISIEYEDDYHYSSIARGMVRIVQGKSVFKLPKWAVFVVIGVLIIIFILYQFKSKNFELKFVKEKKVVE